MDKSDTTHGESNFKNAMDNGTTHREEDNSNISTENKALQVEKKDDECLKMIEKANNE